MIPFDRGLTHESVARTSALRMTRLDLLMAMSTGSPHVRVGLPDGPVDAAHPDLAHMRLVPIRRPNSPPQQDNDVATQHGTFVAGLLAGRRGGPSAGICPECPIAAVPIFQEGRTGDNGVMPSATPSQLADAIVTCVDADARVINISVGFATPSVNDERALEQALTHAALRGAIVVAAAGNQGAIGTSALTRHPAVIPVVACDVLGATLRLSNISLSIGRRGLAAPGASITSLRAGGGVQTGSGTSVAAPFVTGAIALLLSLFPRAPHQTVRRAVLGASRPQRRTPIPPCLNAEAAYQSLRSGRS